ncbi:EamA family transporter RarD [Sulfurospirillum arcachonense]|uniref:EamA family transporter RarD n=1 Tax=Sulfurospirillum arcachonense TaxID=57666 RepID=UPI0004AE0F75|nr:EamA family transporter RarD [Sulfurospirillum arcachonense]
MKNFSQEIQGTIYAIMAFSFWGLVPIYFKMVSHVNPSEVLVHRILWSVIFLIVLLFITKSFKNLIIILKDTKKLKILFISALLVSLNWLTFIWAISNNKIVEASLGYYINPLLSVLLGYIFFKERMTKLQTCAIFIAFMAIVYQVYALGQLPIISLMLAFSFALYGLARKKVHVESISGLLVETFLVSPFALFYLIYLFTINQNAFVIPLDITSYLLIAAGLITIIPLIWFNSAATKISMMKLGFLQYIGPSISFLLAIFVYNEPLNTDKLITFIMIWFALFLFSIKRKSYK